MRSNSLSFCSSFSWIIASLFCPRRKELRLSGMHQLLRKNNQFSQCKPSPQITWLQIYRVKKSQTKSADAALFPLCLVRSPILWWRWVIGTPGNFPPSAHFILHITPKWTQTFSAWPLHPPEPQPGYPLLFPSLQKLGDPFSHMRAASPREHVCCSENLPDPFPPCDRHSFT